MPAFKSAVSKAAVALVFLSGLGRADLVSAGFRTSFLLQYDPTKTVTIPGTRAKAYDVFLTIGPGPGSAAGVHIASVAVKMANDVSLPPLSVLKNAPGTVNSWTLTAAQNSSACDGAGRGFLCAMDGMTPPAKGGFGYGGRMYTWEFMYATTDELFLNPLGSRIRVEWAANGPHGPHSIGFTSQAVTLACAGCNGRAKVPEAGGIEFLGAMLLCFVPAARKRIT